MGRRRERRRRGGGNEKGGDSSDARGVRAFARDNYVGHARSRVVVEGRLEVFDAETGTAMRKMQEADCMVCSSR